jgi:hypothetical protein
MGCLEESPIFKLPCQPSGSDGLDGFADYDWGKNITRRSTTGLLARFNRGVIKWRSKMQKTVSLSTAEAECFSASEMAIEILYLRNLLENMGFMQAPDTPVHEDNAAWIEWGNLVIGGRERAKHIDIRKHFAHETNQSRKMRLIKMDTSGQLERDIFTKPQQLPQFLACREGTLTGPSGKAFSPRGPCDSGGGDKSPSLQAREWMLRTSDSKGWSHVGPSEGCLQARNLQGPSGVCRPSQVGPWSRVQE